jgi:hypothetical protein
VTLDAVALDRSRKRPFAQAIFGTVLARSFKGCKHWIFWKDITLDRPTARRPSDFHWRCIQICAWKALPSFTQSLFSSTKQMSHDQSSLPAFAECMSRLKAGMQPSTELCTNQKPKIKLSQARQPKPCESAPESHLSPSLSDWRTAYSSQSL